MPPLNSDYFPDVTPHHRAIRIGPGWGLLIARGSGLLLAGLAWATSTAPVRNESPEESAAPPDTANPIYFPLMVGASAGHTPMAAETLLQQFMERHSAMDYPAAAEAALRLAAVAPDRPVSQYNLACVMSKLHRTDEALTALEVAIDCGWRDLTHTRIDPDLDLLRGSKRFEALLAKMQSKIDAERIVPAPLRTDSWETVAADLNRHVPEFLESWHVPGATVALIRDGEPVWTSAFGVRDIRSGAVMKADTQFRLRAPLHLMALLAAQRSQSKGQLQLVELFAEAADLNRVALAPTPGVGASRLGAGSTSRRRVTTTGADQRETRAGPAVRMPSYGRNSFYGLIRIALETISGQSFPDHCKASLLRPLAMADTVFVEPPDDSGAVALGHSALGTPMRPGPPTEEFSTGCAVFTTADDLAQLVGVLSRMPHECIESKWHGMALLELVAEGDASIPGSLALALDLTRTDEGFRAELADLYAGSGCLLRWYPQTGDGVIVLFNSATGRDAALRIAHIALGGS